MCPTETHPAEIPKLLDDNLTAGDRRSGVRGHVGKPLCENAIVHRSLKPVGRKLGMPWLSWHDLRRTFATLADLEKISIGERKELMGHARAQPAGVGSARTAVGKDRDRREPEARKQEGRCHEKGGNELKVSGFVHLASKNGMQLSENTWRFFSLRSKRSLVRIESGAPHSSRTRAHFPTMWPGSRLFSSQMLSMRSVSGSSRQAMLTVHGFV